LYPYGEPAVTGTELLKSKSRLFLKKKKERERERSFIHYNLAKDVMRNSSYYFEERNFYNSNFSNDLQLDVGIRHTNRIRQIQSESLKRE